MNFKNKFLFEQRKHASQSLKDKYPNKIPIIIINHTNYNLKTKYLVSRDIALSHFFYKIYQEIKINTEDTVYFIINETIPLSSTIISLEYEKHKDKDGMLYIDLIKENVFGCDFS